MSKVAASRPTDDEIATAIEWLRVYDGEGEDGSNEADCKAVADWLERELYEHVLRRKAREAGVPVDRLRSRLAQQFPILK